MTLLFPFLSMCGETSGKILDKLNFNRNKIGYKPLTVITFFIMFIFTLFFIIFTRQSLPMVGLFSGFLIVAMILISTFQNIFDVVGLSEERLSLREPISNFQPLLTAFFAFFLFPSERDGALLFLILIGVCVLLWVNTEKKHLKLFSNRSTRFFVFSITLNAILSNIYKAGLFYVSPAWLFVFRTAGVFFLTAIFLRFSFKSLTKSQVRFSIYAGIAYFVGSLATLYSIQYLGLLYTTFLLLLEPSLKYLGSYFIIGEQIGKKELVGSFILILLIVLSLVF